MNDKPENKRFNFKDWAHRNWEWERVIASWGWNKSSIPPVTQPIKVNRQFPVIRQAIVQAIG